MATGWPCIWERENNEPESVRVREGYLPVAIVDDGRREADHIRRHDPRSIVARCEAELAILDECAPGGYRQFYVEAGVITSQEHVAMGAIGTRVIRLLAAGYKHRTGYLEEWKP